MKNNNMMKSIKKGKIKEAVTTVLKAYFRTVPDDLGNGIRFMDDGKIEIEQLISQVEAAIHKYSTIHGKVWVDDRLRNAIGFLKEEVSTGTKLFAAIILCCATNDGQRCKTKSHGKFKT